MGRKTIRFSIPEDALEALGKIATERKRGEKLAELVREYVRQQQEKALAPTPEPGIGLLEQMENRIKRLESLVLKEGG